MGSRELSIYTNVVPKWVQEFWNLLLLPAMNNSRKFGKKTHRYDSLGVQGSTRSSIPNVVMVARLEVLLPNSRSDALR